MRNAVLLTALVAMVGLSACDRNRTPTLLNVKSNTDGPDEFAIMPNRPLEIPEQLDRTNLPAPTPGGSNRTDINPISDAVVALGGNPNAGSNDGRLVSYVSRYGVSPGIRESLAAEDIEFRRKNDGRLLERLFNVNVYYKAYSKQSLDQYRELERLRRAGIRTVSAPPEELQDN